MKIEIHIHRHEPRRSEELEKVLALTDSALSMYHKLRIALLVSNRKIIKEKPRMSDDLQVAIVNLTTQFKALKDLIDQAEAALTAVPQRIADAVAAAEISGAKPEQLQALNDLVTTMATETGELTSAIAAAAAPVAVQLVDTPPATNL